VSADAHGVSDGVCQFHHPQAYPGGRIRTCTLTVLSVGSKLKLSLRLSPIVRG